MTLRSTLIGADCCMYRGRSLISTASIGLVPPKRLRNCNVTARLPAPADPPDVALPHAASATAAATGAAVRTIARRVICLEPPMTMVGLLVPGSRGCLPPGNALAAGGEIAYVRRNRTMYGPSNGACRLWRD